MKKNYSSVFVFILLLLTAFSCKTTKNATNQQSYIRLENTNNQPWLWGKVPLNVLQQPPFDKWMVTNYQNYKPDTAKIEALKQVVQNKQVQIFLGTWCGDSKREVPKMLKVLQLAGVDTNNVELICVSSTDSIYKQSWHREEKGKNIHRVPTLIVYNGDKEVGRIVESPKQSIENDLWEIIAGKVYQPKYPDVTFLQQQIKQFSKTSFAANKQVIVDSLQKISKSPSALNSYAYVLMAQKDWKTAFTVLKMNEALYPKDKNVYDSIAEWYEKRKQYANAIQYYKKVIDIDSSDKNALQKIAYLEKKLM
ncbi:MAG: hypothetical protein ACOVNR_06365 [Chitinophagaceae bacterium]